MSISRASFAIMAGASMAGIQVAGPALAQEPIHDRLAVAWNDWKAGSDLARAMSTAPPWAFETDPLDTGPEIVMRFAGDRLYAVSTTDDTISVVAPDTWVIERVYSLSEGSEPLDIAVVSADTAYVTRRAATHLLRLDLETGGSEEVVDLGIFADPDGVPDMAMMALHEGRLLVQIRRIGGPGWQFVPPAYLAVVDVATEQLVDVDPVAPGVQAIELEGTDPKFKMQIVPETRRLFVSATGEAFDEGGIEMIDLDTLQSVGLAVREIDDTTGVDLGAFVMVAPDRGYLTFTTDLLLSSHLVAFSVPGGVDPTPLHTTLEYFTPVMVHDARTDTFFFPESGGPGAWGVHVFDATSGARLTTEPIATGGPPTDLALLCDGDCAESAEIPAVSHWGMAVMVLLLLCAATIGLGRRRPV